MTATVTPDPLTPEMAPSPSNPPGWPARTWSAAVDALETSMNGATIASPDSTSLAESAARSDTCLLLASTTAAPSSHRAMARPCRDAIASISVLEPRTMTRVRAMESRPSNDRRSLERLAR
jgi:hypothetical protein